MPRRRFLCSTVAGAVMALAGAATIGTRPAAAQTTLTPDEALKTMMDGNQLFVAGDYQSLNEDLSILKAHTAEKQ
ncbi:MAG: carbonic anhydrase, partial [Hyphomicrobiales bacterium]|nr:carbonic anhydrase [Hyphomicrobiales bacterium]